MIEYIAFFAFVALSIVALLVAILLRHWMQSALAAIALHISSLYTRRIHLHSDDACHDVLVIFRDPTFAHVDLRPLLAHFEEAELLEAGINYALPLDALEHALAAKDLILPHYLAHPDKRYTFVGLGIGGYIAAYVASAMPLETQTFSTTHFDKCRARTLLVGTPVAGMRPTYAATLGRLYLHRALRRCLTAGTPENITFWNDAGVLQHAHLLIAKHDFRTAPSAQMPPRFSTKYVETASCPDTPWYGLLTDATAAAALAYLWDFKHV